MKLFFPRLKELSIENTIAKDLTNSINELRDKNVNPYRGIYKTKITSKYQSISQKNRYSFIVVSRLNQDDVNTNEVRLCCQVYLHDSDDNAHKFQVNFKKKSKIKNPLFKYIIIF